jgi:DNA-binding response OmpR family regulator
MPSKAKGINPTILWVAGRWVGDPSFIPALKKKGYSIITASNGKEAINQIKKEKPDIVVVYAASMRTSGSRICKSIHQDSNKLPILLISDSENQVGDDFEFANTVLMMPFTSRKLINRIVPLLPGDKSQMQKFGPLRLDKKRRQVHCNNKKTILTPRLLHLLNMLLEKRGEVVNRDDLFRKVWRTSYTGDTRTLDVHISWLRGAIENDPRKPKLLRTVRGVGYILDI